VERGVRAFGILGDWGTLSLQEGEWHKTVLDGGRKCNGAWKRIEEQVPETIRRYPFLGRMINGLFSTAHWSL